MTMRKSRAATAATAAVVLGSVGTVKAEAGAIPAATAIAGTTLCVVDGWEYAPRWSTPNNGFVSPSLEDCAMQCEADPVCTGATYIVSGSEKNCWFKDWGTGPVAPPCLPNPNKPLEYQAIIDPAGAGCAGIEYMATTVYNCDDEMLIEEKPDLTMAGAPVAAGMATVTDIEDLKALDPPYVGYPGVDYSPTQIPAPSVGIVDIGAPEPGLIVMDAFECAAECTADPLCNAASYYGDNAPDTWPGGKNCYLKTLQGCMMPDDPELKADNSIFMIGGLPCAEALAPLAVIPEMEAPVPAPLAATPLGVAPVADPLVPTPAPLAGPLGFSPTPGGIPPLETTNATTTTTGNDTTAGVGPTVGTRGVAPAPAADVESGPSIGSGTVPPSTGAAVGVLPGLSVAAAVGAALLL